jgi:hypothetical protein
MSLDDDIKSIEKLLSTPLAASDIDEANALLDQIRSTISSVPAKRQTSLRTSIAKWQTIIEAAEQKALLGDSSSSSGGGDEKKGGTTTSAAKKDNNVAVLRDSLKTLVDTEVVAKDTITRLERDKVVIANAQANTAKITANLRTANTITGKMARRI